VSSVDVIEVRDAKTREKWRCRVVMIEMRVGDDEDGGKRSVVAVVLSLTGRLIVSSNL
jgi:hypothetical protein